jgi:dihydrolipoamide dehydrogenase
MKTARHDLVVLGGGPAGYVAAIRAAQLGMDTAVIDENAVFGGTCVRVGCIPSKALLESSHLYHEAKSQFAAHGLQVGDLTLNLAQMMERKREIVDQLTNGIDMLFKKHKITAYHGRGRMRDVESIALEPTVDPSVEPTLIQGDKIMLALGSRPARLRGVDEDGQRIGNSTMALSFEDVPERLIVIGGGYIGLELGSVWSRLGSEVITLEALDRILPGMDGEIAKLAHRIFGRQGIEFRTSTFVESARVEGERCQVQIKDGELLEADRVLVATGRVPATFEVGLEDIGLQLDERGFIPVDADFRTNVENVYAIGDCTGGALLAHKAMEEGIVCAERMSGLRSHVNYDVIPAIVYTHPEIASVGKTEEELKAAGVEYVKGMCPFGANGRAKTLGDSEGRVKVLAEAHSDRVLGVHIIGVRAGDIIAEAATAMEFGASSEDIARTCHAHPTLSEALHEAAMAVDKRAIHTA